MAWRPHGLRARVLPVRRSSRRAPKAARASDRAHRARRTCDHRLRPPRWHEASIAHCNPVTKLRAASCSPTSEAAPRRRQPPAPAVGTRELPDAWAGLQWPLGGQSEPGASREVLEQPGRPPRAFAEAPFRKPPKHDRRERQFEAGSMHVNRHTSAIQSSVISLAPHTSTEVLDVELREIREHLRGIQRLPGGGL